MKIVLPWNYTHRRPAGLDHVFDRQSRKPHDFILHLANDADTSFVYALCSHGVSAQGAHQAVHSEFTFELDRSVHLP